MLKEQEQDLSALRERYETSPMLIEIQRQPKPLTQLEVSRNFVNDVFSVVEQERSVRLEKSAASSTVTSSASAEQPAVAATPGNDKKASPRRQQVVEKNDEFEL
jgi:hypothetical protein